MCTVNFSFIKALRALAKHDKIIFVSKRWHWHKEKLCTLLGITRKQTLIYGFYLTKDINFRFNVETNLRISFHHVLLNTTSVLILLLTPFHTRFSLSLVCHNSFWSTSPWHWIAHSECLSFIYSLCFRQWNKSVLSKLECSSHNRVFTFCRAKTLPFKQVSVT